MLLLDFFEGELLRPSDLNPVLLYLYGEYELPWSFIIAWPDLAKKLFYDSRWESFCLIVVLDF